MIVRPLEPSDIPILEQMQRDQGFDYAMPDLTGSHMEAVAVVEDEQTGEVLCAVAAERILQLYFFAGDFGPPHARAHAIRLLHESMIPALKQKGYNEVNSFLPPRIAERFGRWLERRFRWTPNWSSWTRHF
jgi:hypothetical protein